MARKHYESDVKDVLRKGDQGQIVRDLQTAANVVLEDWKFPWRKIIMDGDLGPSSLKGINMAGYLLGLSRAQLRNILQGKITVHAQKIIRREKKRSFQIKRNQNKRMEDIRKLREGHNDIDPDNDGLGRFEGTVVAAWIVPWLEKARENGWVGQVTSGWRDPEYSQSLCYQMCGSPTCPGKCAGLTSNHVGKGDHNGDPGAIDVTDYVRFGQIMRQLGSPLHNSIGASDPVHFSAAGN